ncbi:hypothetical protein M422DRAFT_204158 [Sphaerobolus stellatus SS14]|nr:hypothetical protein M422DRAFT_204158 [Sphaerobolus stellatus SS14]
MPQQTLGKRLRSHSTASSTMSPTTRSVALTRKTRRSAPSPEPIPPKSKRAKITTVDLEDDDSNKENIPPDTFYVSPNSPTSDSGSGSLEAIVVTPRSQRASRRVSARVETPARRRVSSPNLRVPPTPISPSPSPLSRLALDVGVETPSKSLAHLTLASPPPTPDTYSDVNEEPLPKTQPLHLQVRALLRPQNQDAPLIGREKERSIIQDFLNPLVSDEECSENDATSLYISGAPGTGKTALVNEVLASLSASAEHAQISTVYVNCMSVGVKDGLAGVWLACANELDASEASKRSASSKADWVDEFSKLVHNRKCVLVLDEIDHLAANEITIAQVFSLAAASQTRPHLRVIGISNMHTLTHSKPSEHTRTLHFEPYTTAQMKAVLTARLASISSNDPLASKIFPLPTIALLSMKIGSQTGDIRTVFSVARRALDAAIAAAPFPSIITVTPVHIIAALKVSSASIGNSQAKNGTETITRVRNLGLQHRFVLSALLLATKRAVDGLSLTGAAGSKGKSDGAPSIDMTTLHTFYCTVLSRGSGTAFAAVNRVEFADLVNILEGNGLVQVSQARGKGASKAKGMQLVSIAGGVREEELVRGLTGTPDATSGSMDVKEEEVRHIWEKEMARLTREKNAKETKMVKAEFEGAEED